MLRIVTKNWLSLVVTFCAAFCFTLIIAQTTKTLIRPASDSTSNEEVTNSDDNTKTHTSYYPDLHSSFIKAPNAPSFINLQETVDNWYQSLSNSINVGVMIYDLDNQEVAAAINPDRVFNLASVYKLFFAYAGYYEIDHGNVKGDEFFVTTEEKGPLNVYQCLDLIIRESYNDCADPLRNSSEWGTYYDNFVEALGIKNTYNLGLTSTPRDLIELLKVIYVHEHLSDDSWSRLSDSMLNQPVTTDNWRQGIPAGFQTPLVYDKVGWSYDGNKWAIFNDVALLDFAELGRHYAIVVLTENFQNLNKIHELATNLEHAIILGSLGR